MTRVLPICVALAICLPALAADSEKDFKPVTVDGEDVAAVSREQLSRGTTVRVRLVARGRGGSFRLGEARTVDSGVNAMMDWNAMSVNVNYSQRLRSDAFIALAAGPKDAPLKLEKIETDAETASTKLTFEGGMVIQVTIGNGVGGNGTVATSRPQP